MGTRNNCRISANRDNVNRACVLKYMPYHFVRIFAIESRIRNRWHLAVGGMSANLWLYGVHSTRIVGLPMMIREETAEFRDIKSVSEA